MAKKKTDKTANQIAALYKLVDERIQAEIAKAFGSGKTQDVKYLEQRRAAITALLRAAEAQAAQATAIEIRNNYAYARMRTDTRLERAGIGGVKKALSELDVRRINLLIDNTTSRYSGISTVIGRRSDDLLRQIALEQLSANTAAGGTTADLAQTLRDAYVRSGLTFSDDGGVHWLNINGKNWRADTYAKLEARTSIRAADSYSNAQYIREIGGDLVDISVTETGADCPICGEFDGQTFSLSGEVPEHSEYEVLPEFPPFHPNCFHEMDLSDEDQLIGGGNGN